MPRERSFAAGLPDVLARFCAGLADGYAPRVEVIMVDFTGRSVIACFPEYADQPGRTEGRS